MAEVKLTKNELRDQQKRLSQLERYLPTLQLKKAMLQLEIHQARQEIAAQNKIFEEQRERVNHFSSLLATKVPIDLKAVAQITEINKRYENIAGVEVPIFEEAIFQPLTYSLFDTPPWVDAAIKDLRKLSSAKAKIQILEEKKRALEEEQRMVSIRVNLFEKILIPRAKKNIKKIKVFLGDQQLAAVSRAKVAKTIIERSR